MQDINYVQCSSCQGTGIGNRIVITVTKAMAEEEGNPSAEGQKRVVAEIECMICLGKGFLTIGGGM